MLSTGRMLQKSNGRATTPGAWLRRWHRDGVVDLRPSDRCRAGLSSPSTAAVTEFPGCDTGAGQKRNK
jgi:hypothetical protein